MMIGSSLPLAERLDAHPVHRATAMLRQALLSSAVSPPDPAELWEAPAFCLDPPGLDNAAWPDGFAHPAMTDDGDMFCQPPDTYEDDLAAEASVDDATGGDGMLDTATEAQLQNLVQAFYERQRQASLLVACSVVTAVVLTFVGLVLAFSMGGEPVPREKAAPKQQTSMTWTAPHPEITPAVLRHAGVQQNKPAKAASLLIRAKSDMDAPGLGQTANGQVILADADRPLALAPLLPLGSARYLLLRGLPEEASLSAGRRTGAGTWMIRAAEVPGLTLTAGESASGDYPLEVYLLDAANGPQARHRLVLRITQAPLQVYAAGLGLGWPTALAPQSAESDAAPAAAAKPDALRERAQRLLGEGDVAAARFLLTQLAERGEADAAYELALTYDPEVLDRAGVRDVGSDAATARAWYEYAARAGHVGALQRLQMLPKPRGGA